jgi:hypothetical protein
MQTIGPKWTRLATFFAGRTDIEVKSHWMQRFASHSNLHIPSRNRLAQPMFHPPPPLPPIQAHVQFMPLPGPPVIVPKVTTPHTDIEWYLGPSRDPSFSSRSFLDFNQWGD